MDLVLGKTDHRYIQVACHSSRILKTNVEYCCHDIMAATMNVYWEQINRNQIRIISFAPNSWQQEVAIDYKSK